MWNMEKLKLDLEPTLYERAIESSTTHGRGATVQKVVPLSPEEAVPEVQFNFSAPEEFKIDVDKYIANHVLELKPLSMHTKKAFCRTIIQQYMDEHP